MLDSLPKRTPIVRTTAGTGSVESDRREPASGTASSEARTPKESRSFRERGHAPILVEAEEALRVYHENILLVGEALLTLELIERGALDESEQRIHALTQAFPEKEGAILVRTLLNHWLSRTRTAAAGDLPDSSEGAGVAGVARELEASARADAENLGEVVASLKREGLNFYSRGDLNGAVSCWRRILQLEPDDAETRQFLQRAEAILKKRRAG